MQAGKCERIEECKGGLVCVQTIRDRYKADEERTKTAKNSQNQGATIKMWNPEAGEFLARYISHVMHTIGEASGGRKKSGGGLGGGLGGQIWWASARNV